MPVLRIARNGRYPSRTGLEKSARRLSRKKSPSKVPGDRSCRSSRAITLERINGHSAVRRRPGGETVIGWDLKHPEDSKHCHNTSSNASRATLVGWQKQITPAFSATVFV